MDNDWVGYMVVVVFICATIIIGILSTKSYKRGQIDAINGKIKYELIENAKKEMVWDRILN